MSDDAWREYMRDYQRRWREKLSPSHREALRVTRRKARLAAVHGHKIDAEILRTEEKLKLLIEIREENNDIP